MRTANLCPTCAKYINTLCVLYEGEYLSCLDISPGDDLETILVKLNSVLSSNGICTTTSTTTEEVTTTSTTTTESGTTTSTTTEGETTTTTTTEEPITTTTTTTSNLN